MMGILMGSCQSVIDALSDIIEGRVGFMNRLRFNFHLGMCPKCKAYFQQFKRVYKECGHVEPQQLPEDFEQVMSQVLKDWKKSD